MAVDFVGYNRRLQYDGETEQERTVTMMQEAFSRDVENHPGYEAEAKRNGVTQPMLFSRGEVRYKINVTCLPGDELYPGDLVEVYDEYWICTETRAMDTLQTTGLLWLCNHKFAFQNHTSEIHECWGVLDSGVYSTTIGGDASLAYLDKQFKIYLPYNDETKYIFIDKRIATELLYDQYGDEILAVYKITGVDHTSKSYGQNAHLLILNARSDAYNPSTDNIEHMICDYIDPADDPVRPVDVKCEIIGNAILPIEKSCKYIAKFYRDDGSEADDVTAVWSTGMLPVGITADVDGNLLTLIANKKAYVGSKITLSVQDDAGLYVPALFDVEVKAYG